ncbi:10021_t:CDS:2 [Ambispora leptoticha]|uniref:10021_t:CDS:1 n=1 Tax=Ambispora leptoticha TaxID=144679 RepID=A0A9N9FZZ4_9GLOM|nr:10021_t:CDS:2 [Ambispora leptoticha]
MSHFSQIEEYENTSEKDFHTPVEDEKKLSDTRFYVHYFYEHLFNGNIGAPVHEKLQKGAKVLEYRCDSGIWTREIAIEYPDTEFYAVDSTVPNSRDDGNNINITLIECDIFKKLPFPDNEFDYVYAKDNLLFMTTNTFRAVLLEIFRILKPGGWLEVVYSCKTDLIPGLGYTRLTNAWHSWLTAQNIDYDINPNLENYLQETGKTESMSRRIEEMQVGSGNTMGEFKLEITLMFYRSARSYLAPFMNISFEEFDDLVNNVENELNANKIKITFKQVIAKKKSTNSEEN